LQQNLLLCFNVFALISFLYLKVLYRQILLSLNFAIKKQATQSRKEKKTMMWTAKIRGLFDPRGQSKCRRTLYSLC